MNYLQNVRACSNCGKKAKRWARECSACGFDLPKSVENRHPRTDNGERRHTAQELLLSAMQGPACVCGLRGPHECTRTEEWRKDCLSRLAMRQL